MRQIFRHIIREPVKTVFVLAAALFFTITLGFLQNTITNLQAEIDRLYTETAVNAELRLGQNYRASRRALGDPIPMAVVEDIIALEIVQEIYLEAVALAFIAMQEVPYSFALSEKDILFAVEDVSYLTEYPQGFASRDVLSAANMEIEFAAGFGKDNFIYTTNEAIPLILSEELAQRHELNPGDSTYILHYAPVLFRDGNWHNTPAIVIGIHNGEALPHNLQNAAIVPLPILKSMFGYFTGFVTCRFTINPLFNQHLAELDEQMEFYALRRRYPWREFLTVDIWDQELRIGIAAFSQHLALLRLLFPIAVVVSAIMGLAITTLVTLQNAKNAAIMRVLGMSSAKTKFVLWCQQMIVCIVGVMLGLLISWTLFIAVALPYITGAFVGAIIGAVLVSSKPPLDLLQVKE